MAEENEECNTHSTAMADPLKRPLPDNEVEFAEAGDPLDEGRSSSLSDLEDGADEIDRAFAISTLSRQIEADSEAETERLENSPHKNRNNNEAGVDSIIYNKSPSKLAQSAVPETEELEIFSDSAVSSPGPSDEELDSETPSDHSALSDNENNVDEHTRDSASRKRKHLDMEDESGCEDDADGRRRRRRRTQSVRSDAEEQSELGLSREATIEPLGEAQDDQDLAEGMSTILQNNQDLSKSKNSKITGGKHGKKRSRENMGNIIEEREEPERLVELGAGEARPDTDDEERAQGEDEDVEAAARDEEEYARKMSAMDSLAALERQFAALRDRLYDERIAALNDEMAQLSSTKPSHPEFLQQLGCVRKYRDEKFDTEQKLLVYKIKSLKTKSVAQRSQIHSAYFQTVRDVREKHLDRIGERLSRVRRDHVKTDEKVPGYSVPFPTRRSTQITQQSSYNKEVSVLSGIAKYVGFPAAPTVTAALQAEMDEDMERMGIALSHNQINKPTQSKLSRSAFSSAMSRPGAEEQFLEQNPWANPQHPIHQQHIGRLSRQISDQTQVADSSVTPATQKSVVNLNKPVDSSSTIPEHPSAQASSALATPYSNNAAPQHQTSAVGAAGRSQQLPASLENLLQQNDRLRSISPTETRKHNLPAHGTRPKKPDMTNDVGKGIEETCPQPQKISAIALFGSAARSEAVARNGPLDAEIHSRHPSSSPITLHQHARENNLTSTTAFSGIGAR